MKYAVLATGAALLIALSHVPTASAETYPANIQKTFLAGCQSSFVQTVAKKGAKSMSKMAQPMCSCLLTKISAKMSLVDFEQVDSGLRAQKAGKPLDAETEQKVATFRTVSSAAASQCIKQIKM